MARTLEPRAPRPDLRIAALRRIREAGIRAGVLCSPLMPGINDSRASIAAVARAASEAGANFFAAGALFLKPCSMPTFLDFIAQNFPAQREAYRQRYASDAFVSSEYRKRVGDIVGALCREYKLGKRYDDMPPLKDAPAPELVQIQPWLPFDRA